MMKIRCINFTLGWLALASMVCLLLPAGLYAGVPTDQVRSTVDRVLEILKNPKPASPAAKQERRNRLRQVIYPRFDFAEMAQRSLGASWRRITPSEQQEFVQLFTQLLEESYINNIEAYNGDKILYSGETQEQDYAEVNTKIVTKQGEQIAVDYRLHKVDGDWKVYDVVIENISLVNNYRTQFSRLLVKSSFPELLDRIRDKLSTAR
ncbi:MAG TPA: ABC transporter substrate-binding protein [Methylomirabilota bacterium]|nr:ABC transporter substrate-binding protein [Methylomirabilota bacterium]